MVAWATAEGPCATDPPCGPRPPAVPWMQHARVAFGGIAGVRVHWGMGRKLMGVHGSTGAGGAGIPSLPAALRLAAMTCCTPPPLQQQPAPEQQRRPIVRGGGGEAQPDHAGRQQHGMTRMQHALHQRCQPAQVVLPPLATVIGGGPVPLAAPPAGTPQDPAFFALVGLLGDAQLAEQPPSALRQLGAQLANLLASTMDRARAVLPAPVADPAAHAAATDPAPQQPAARADAPVAPMQPLPPPPLGPMLTLDPTLGTIVDIAPPSGSDDVGGDGPLRDPGELPDDEQPLLPSSWVPLALGNLRRGARAGLRALVDRIDALLAEVGMSRLQLLALVLVATLAVAFGIDVVASILEGR